MSGDRGSVSNPGVEMRDLIRKAASKTIREVDQVQLALVTDAGDGITVGVTLDGFTAGEIPASWASPVTPAIDMRVAVISLKGGQSHYVVGVLDTPGQGSGEFLPLAGGVLTGFLTLHADPDAALKAATKQYVDAVLPSGTRMIFDQDSAPTGWTRDVATVDDRVIRIVTGSRADGGTWTQPNHTHTTSATTGDAGDHAHTNPNTAGEGSHTHTGPSHTHTGPSHAHTNPLTATSATTAIGNEGSATTFEYTIKAHAHTQGNTGNSGTALTGAQGTGATSGGTSHAHTQGGTGNTGTHAHSQATTDGGATAASWRPLHRDMIIASKD